MTLVLMLAAPALAALVIMRAQTRYVRAVALTGTGLSLALSIVAALSAGAGSPLATSADWAPAAGLTFRLAADGVSSALLVLNFGLGILALLATSTADMRRPHLFVAMLLVAQVGAAGVLLAQDLVLFFVFWEIVLVPFLVLIAVFGEGRREYAALKLLIYTGVGSLAMLLSIAGMFVLSGSHSFAIGDLARARPGTAPLFLGLSTAHLLFLGFALAFAVKTPLFPFHGWLADAYTATPTPAVMLLAGIVSKLGPYGFYRVAIPLLPGAARDFSGILVALSAVGVVYGALLALAQRDAKRTVVYLSLSHMCFITLGIVGLTAAGISGGVLQMVNHGVLIAALFFIVGHLERALGTRDRARLHGLSGPAPVLASVFLLLSLAVLGLPGLNGFAGEYLIMMGTYSRSWPALALAAVGVVLASWYTLRLYQGLMNGRDAPEAGEGDEAVVASGRAELALADLGVLVPLAAAAVAIGVYPGPLVDLLGQGVAQLTRVIGS